MIDRNESEIFKLEVDDIAKTHMLETGRWGKFLAIVGFIMIAIGLIGGYFYSVMLASYYETLLGSNRISSMFIYPIFVVMAGLMFYPSFALFRFSTKIKTGLSTMNREQFNSAFANLRGLFTYCGILTILMLILYGLVIVLLIGALSMR